VIAVFGYRGPDRRRPSLLARARRRLYYRGALAACTFLYGVMAVTVPLSSGVHVPLVFEALFGVAAISGMVVVWRPRMNLFRHVSAMTAVAAPAARALIIAVTTSDLTGPSQISAVAVWTLCAGLAFLVWPVILPPHIDVGRLAAALDGQG
jgi:hypothetical protein